MWQFSCLVFVVMFVLNDSVEQDNIINLLTTVQNKIDTSINLECQPLEFINKVLQNPTEPIVCKFIPTEINQSIPLDFTFRYANRETIVVTISQNAMLTLKDGVGNVDFIAPLHEGYLKPDDKSCKKYCKTNKYFLVKWSKLTCNDNSDGNEDIVTTIIYETGEIIVIYGELNEPQTKPNRIVNYFKVKHGKAYEYDGPSIPINSPTKGLLVYINECKFERKNDAPPTKVTDLQEPKPPKMNVNYEDNPGRAISFFEKISAEPAYKVLTVASTNSSIIDFNFNFNNFTFQTVTIEKRGKILLEAKKNGSPYVQVEPIPTIHGVNVGDFTLKYGLNGDELTILLQNLNITTADSSSNSTEILLVFKKVGPIEIIYKNLVKTNINGSLVVLYTSTNGTVIEHDIEFRRIFNGTIVKLGDDEPAQANNVVVNKISDDIDLENNLNDTMAGPVVDVTADKPIISPTVTLPIVTTENPQISKINVKYDRNPERAQNLFNQINVNDPAENNTIHYNFEFNNVSVQTITIEKLGKIYLGAKDMGLLRIRIEPIPIFNSVFVEDLTVKYVFNDDELIILLQNIRIKTEHITSCTNDILLVLKKIGVIEIIYKNLTKTSIVGSLPVLHVPSKDGSTVIKINFENIVNGTVVRILDDEDAEVTWINTNNNSQGIKIPDLQETLKSHKINDKGTTPIDEKPIIPVKFLSDTEPANLTNGEAAKIEMENIEVIQDLKNNVNTSISTNCHPSEMCKYTELDPKLVEQFDDVYQKMVSTTVNDKTITLKIDQCPQMTHIQIISLMERYIGNNEPFKPDAIINHAKFTAMIWENFKIGNSTYRLRALIYPDGDVVVLYKPKTLTSPHNLLPDTNKISPVDRQIVHFNICAIKRPIKFEDLLKEFKQEDTIDTNIDVVKLDGSTLGTYLKLNPDPNEDTACESKRLIKSKFNISYGSNELDLTTIYVTNNPAGFYLKKNSAIHLVPSDVENNLVFKSTTTQDYITMTWTNLKVLSDQIRVVIFKSGIILIIYDIENPVENVFLTGSPSIRLERGTMVKLNVVTLLTKSINDIPDLFNGITKSVVHLSPSVFNDYFALSPDSLIDNCLNNVCTVNSMFGITYGESQFNTIHIANSIQLYFAKEASFSLVNLDEYKPVMSGTFNYSAKLEYVSMTWHWSTTRNTINEIRVIIFPNSELYILYKFTIGTSSSSVYDMLSKTERNIQSGSVVRIAMNEMFKYLMPKILQAEVKTSLGNSSVAQINDGTGKLFSMLINSREDSNALSIEKTKIILSQPNNSNKKDFDLAHDLNCLQPFETLTKDDNNFQLTYTETSEYTSFSLANVTANNYGTVTNITIDVRVLIYPTGDIIIGYKSIKGVPHLDFSINNQPFSLRNGTIIVAHTALCSVLESKEYEYDDVLPEDYGNTPLMPSKLSPKENKASEQMSSTNLINSILSLNFILLIVKYF